MRFGVWGLSLGVGFGGFVGFVVYGICGVWDLGFEVNGLEVSGSKFEVWGMWL